MGDVQRFRERLIPGVGTFVAVLLLLPAVFIILLPLSATAGAVAAVVVTVGVEVLLVVLAPVITVTDGVLAAGSARIPASFTGETWAYRGTAATEARGTGLDARAYTLFRGWIDAVIRIELTDPDDPAPYWLVSTRRPEELSAALVAARTGAA
jgi:hypothetical protein